MWLIALVEASAQNGSSIKRKVLSLPRRRG
jgi:hypothetical protein